MMSVAFYFLLLLECGCVECCYARECRYAECRGVSGGTLRYEGQAGGGTIIKLHALLL